MPVRAWPRDRAAVSGITQPLPIVTATTGVPDGDAQKAGEFDLLVRVLRPATWGRFCHAVTRMVCPPLSVVEPGSHPPSLSMKLPPRQLGMPLQSESWRYSRPMRSISSTITSFGFRVLLPLGRIIRARTASHKREIRVRCYQFRLFIQERRKLRHRDFGSPNYAAQSSSVERVMQGSRYWISPLADETDVASFLSNLTIAELRKCADTRAPRYGRR
jgi:hypothetical protein